MPFLRQLATVLPALCLFLGFEAMFLAPVILIPAISGMLLLLVATHAFFGGRRPLTAEVWQCFVPPATLVLASATFFFLTERSAFHHVLAVIVALLIGAIHRNLYLFLYQPFRYPPNALLHLSVVTDLLATFFGAVGLFGLRLFLGLPAWALVALMAAGSLLLLEQAFWASKIPFRRNAPYAAALALLFAELAAALMGLPVTHVISGAIVAVAFYVLFGVTRAALTGELTKILARRYAATAATGAGILLATARWS